MYRNNHFNLIDDQSEDRPILPSISRIFDNQNGSSRPSSSLRLPPLPASGQQSMRSNTWPQFPLPNAQDYSSRASMQTQTYNRTDFPRDPRVSAMETNQALHALASARSVPRQSSYDSHDDGYYYRGSELASHAAGHGGYDMNTGSSTGYPRAYHTVDDTRDSSRSPVYTRSPYDQRGADSSPSTRHQCGYCQKRFSRPSGLKIHLTTHTGEKPYVCPEEGCHRSFSVRSNMRRHVRIVHQVAPSFEGATDSSEDGDGREE